MVLISGCTQTVSPPPSEKVGTQPHETASGKNEPAAHSGSEAWNYQIDNSKWNDFYVISSKKMIAAGKDGSVCLTSDGGENWKNIRSECKANMAAICFIDEKTGFIFGNNFGNNSNETGSLLTTQDGGLTFREQKTPFTGIAMDFKDSKTGWILDSKGNLIHLTSDGGKTWIHISLNGIFKTIFFINKNEGWAAGQGRIIHTSDGGKTWTLQYESPEQDLNAICFYDNHKGTAAGREVILTTGDGGKTWNRKFIHRGYKFTAAAFFDQNNIFVAGTNGKILQSSDGGENWEIRESNIYNSFTGIRIKNGGLWLTGKNGIVLKSDNAGDSWIFQTTPSSFYWGICFTDKNKGWVAGSLPVVTGTEDGGKLWKPMAHLPDKYGARISFSGQREGWACCYDPKDNNMIILRSGNGGKEWSLKAPKTKGQIMDICAVSENRAAAAGFESAGDKAQRAVIIGTADGGKTWQTNYAGAEGQFNSLYFTNPRTGWAAGTLEGSSHQGNRAVIIKTDNGGSAWSQYYQAKNQDFNDIFFIDDKNGWAAGEELNNDSGIASGLILKTTDGGKTWSKTLTAEDEHFNVLFFTDVNTGWAACNGRLYATTDGGVSWNIIYEDQGTDITGIWFTDSLRGWIIGSSGILFTSTGGK